GTSSTSNSNQNLASGACTPPYGDETELSANGQPESHCSSPSGHYHHDPYHNQFHHQSYLVKVSCLSTLDSFNEKLRLNYKTKASKRSIFIFERRPARRRLLLSAHVACAALVDRIGVSGCWLGPISVPSLAGAGVMFCMEIPQIRLDETRWLIKS